MNQKHAQVSDSVGLQWNKDLHFSLGLGIKPKALPMLTETSAFLFHHTPSHPPLLVLFSSFRLCFFIISSGREHKCGRSKDTLQESVLSVHPPRAGASQALTVAEGAV